MADDVNPVLHDLDHLPQELHIEPAEERDRLEHQVEALQRQLDHRIRQVAALEVQLAAAAESLARMGELERKAAVYDSLLQRRTMRALRGARRALRAAASVVRRTG